MVESSSPSRSASTDDDEAIYYLGYGPIVNRLVRKRRGLEVRTAVAVILPEHRLTFAFGGVVNIVPQRGYEVHGVLMKFNNQQEWEDFQKYDAGYNLDQVKVNPYDDPEREILAYTFVMKDFDGEKIEGTLEKLPQERYLKLIAAGLRSYNVDTDYIEDHIMSVPYIPKTKPEDFKRFPVARQPLPRITFQNYEERLCRSASRGNVFFIVGKHVIKLDPHDPENPCSVWFRQRAHGKPDITLTLHKEIVDPDMPPVDTVEELTDLHFQWSENQILEYLGQGDMTATAVFELGDPGPRRSTMTRNSSIWCCCWPSSRSATAGSVGSADSHTGGSVSNREISHPSGISSFFMNRTMPRGNDPDTDDDESTR